VNATRGRSGVSAAWLALVVVACSAAPHARPGPYPDACASFGFSPKRCEAVVVKGLEAARVARADVVGIEMQPPPEPQGRSLGGGPVAELAFRLADGMTLRQEVACIGIDGLFDPACGDDARIQFSGGVEEDRPCTGVGEATDVPAGQTDPYVGCATPPPTPPAMVVASAKPLRIDQTTIPIDHPGNYRIVLGRATLPNGYLSERTLTIANPQPTAFWIRVLGLEVTSDVPDRPRVGGRYREPFDGLEPVTVTAEFEVIRYVEPSELVLQNVVVR
jgi:hypothetical protein